MLNIYSTCTHSTLITIWNRLKPCCRGVSSLWSTGYAMPVCDATIISTIGWMLFAVAAVVIIIQNVRWWSRAHLCCVWNLPSLIQRPVSALKNATAWKYIKSGLRDGKSRFDPELAKIRVNRRFLSRKTLKIIRTTNFIRFWWRSGITEVYCM